MQCYPSIQLRLEKQHRDAPVHTLQVETRPTMGWNEPDLATRRRKAWEGAYDYRPSRRRKPPRQAGWPRQELAALVGVSPHYRSYLKLCRAGRIVLEYSA